MSEKSDSVFPRSLSAQIGLRLFNQTIKLKLDPTSVKRLRVVATIYCREIIKP